MRLIGQKSITVRLTLLFVMASSAVLLALGLVIASSVEKHFEEQDLKVLTGKMALTRHTLDMLRAPGDMELVVQLLANSLIGQHELELVVVGANYEVIFASSDAVFPMNMVTDSAASKRYRPITWTRDGQSFRGIAAMVPTGLPGNSGEPSSVMVAVATNIAHHQAFMHSFLQTLWLFGAGAAALTGLLGWAAVRRGLAPLRSMREQAQVMTAHHLSKRLPVETVPVELAELAHSLNDMLARLEEAFNRLSGFSSDIAHELRTPVSNLMTQTQVALSRSRSAENYRSILESNAEEFEHMARMISDMLLLAKAENGLVLPCRETLDLADEARALFDYYEAVAEEKNLQLCLNGTAQVEADRLMLRRALGNLLSNAIRHATAGSSVQLSLGQAGGQVTIAVENLGDTIPPEHLERVFDRFFRVDPARQRSTEGVGLGLAIAKSIVVAHGGTIMASSTDGNVTFTIRLPRDLP